MYPDRIPEETPSEVAEGAAPENTAQNSPPTAQGTPQGSKGSLPKAEEWYKFQHLFACKNDNQIFANLLRIFCSIVY